MKKYVQPSVPMHLDFTLSYTARTWRRASGAFCDSGAWRRARCSGADELGQGGGRAEPRRVHRVVVLVLRDGRVRGTGGRVDVSRRDERDPRRVVVGRGGLHARQAGARLWMHEAARLRSGGSLQTDLQRGRGMHGGAPVEAERRRRARRPRGVDGGGWERQRCGEWLARWQSFHSKHSVSVHNQLHELSASRF